MDKASEGGGGTVIGNLAYRPDYELVVGEERVLRRRAGEKKNAGFPRLLRLRRLPDQIFKAIKSSTNQGQAYPSDAQPADRASRDHYVPSIGSRCFLTN